LANPNVRCLPDSPPSAAALRRLRRLVAKRDAAYRKLHEIDAELFRAIADVRESESVSARVLAEALGVGRSTVHDWTQRGRRLRGEFSVMDEPGKRAMRVQAAAELAREVSEKKRFDNERS